MKYLTVGTRKISYELFSPVMDVCEQIKPIGGLWLTEYNEAHKNYNVWVEYLINNPQVLFYMSRNYSMWENPCSLVTLKDNTNIFYLKNKEDLKYLIVNYPHNNGNFSYQQISNIYDGIFIDMYKLLNQVSNYELCRQLFKFSVNSLILFNLDCIDYYQPGIVSIEPFNYECDECEIQNYEINIENVKKKILRKQ